MQLLSPGTSEHLSPCHTVARETNSCCRLSVEGRSSSLHALLCHAACRCGGSRSCSDAPRGPGGAAAVPGARGAGQGRAGGSAAPAVTQRAG